METQVNELHHFLKDYGIDLDAAGQQLDEWIALEEQILQMNKGKMNSLEHLNRKRGTRQIKLLRVFLRK